MKFFLPILIISIIASVHGGGNSECNAYIDLFKSLDLKTQEYFFTTMKFVQEKDYESFFKLLLQTFFLSDLSYYSQDDLTKLNLIKADADDASPCIIPIFKNQ
ncbi:hypothetical protein ACKWTF_014273 [Chironomus riparius]